jgi:hypothetical protein
MPGTLLAKAYPTANEWRELVQTFSAEAIAHKLLLSHVPYVFRDEPLKFALFRRTIADAFSVEPSNVFIVGSAMAGRSLKGDDIDKAYSTESDIDSLIVSEHLFARYVMESLEWVRDVTRPTFEPGKKPKSPQLPPEVTKNLHWLSMHACKGIWRPDSLPPDAPVRIRFFDTFAEVSLKVLGLQLSEDTVAKVNGRVARSFDDAVKDLASSLYRLRKEFEGQQPDEAASPPVVPPPAQPQAVAGKDGKLA